MALAQPTQEEDDLENNKNRNLIIQKWATEKFPNLSNESIHKLNEKFVQYGIKYERDLLSLQGFDNKIDDICDYCNFDRKNSMKLAVEISNINKNSINDKKILLILNETESEKYSELNEKKKEIRNTIKNVEKVIENKNETSNKLLNLILNKLKLKNEEYFENMTIYKKINEANLLLLNELDNQIILNRQWNNKEYKVIEQIENTFPKLNVAQEPFNNLNHILSCLNNEEELLDANLKIIKEKNNEIKNLEKIVEEYANKLNQKINEIENLNLIVTENEKLITTLKEDMQKIKNEAKQYQNLLFPAKCKQNVVKIPLKYHSSLGYVDNNNSFHPNNLLESNDSMYGSKIVKELKNENYDWIIFKIDDNQCRSYVLKYCKIRNYAKDNQGIKSIGIEIGNIEKDEWARYEPFPLNNIKNDRNLQTYSVSIDEKLIFNKNYKFIKLKLFQNHGATKENMCKFVFYEFELFGVCY